MSSPLIVIKKGILLSFTRFLSNFKNNPANLQRLALLNEGITEEV